MPLDLRNAAPGSPEWWLVRLLVRLDARRVVTDEWQDYYDGGQGLKMLNATFREALGASFHRFSANFVAGTIDSIGDRLEINGFRFADAEGDADLWDIWQANDLDGGSQQAHEEALIKGVSYALVERATAGAPRITIETADDCITEAYPKQRMRRMAGLKRWRDAEGHLVVYVYDEDNVYRYRTLEAWDARYRWPPDPFGPDVTLAAFPRGGFDRYSTVVDGDEVPWSESHGLGAVPLVPVLNRPTIRGVGRSEVKPIQSQQDAINYYRAAALVASGRIALPQRYLTNYRLRTDPETGAPIRPFTQLQDLWVLPPRETPDNPAPPFDYTLGQFPGADLAPFLRLIESEVWEMAAISKVPYNELLPQPSSIPASGEAIKASENGLVRKVGKIEIHLGEAWEEVMRTALRAMRDERADLRTAETLWATSETRNEAVRTDAIVKLKAANVIDVEAAWEMMDLSPAAQARLSKRMAAAAPPPPPQVIMPGAVTPAPTGPRMTPA